MVLIVHMIHFKGIDSNTTHKRDAGDIWYMTIKQIITYSKSDAKYL